MKPQIKDIIDEYMNTKSLAKTAEKNNISKGTVRKYLISASLWSNPTFRRIERIRNDHPGWSNAEIAREMKISEKTVQMYTPYNNIIGGDSDRTSKTNDNKIVDFGECGDNASWTLTKDGTLTVSGTGPMWDYGGNSWGVWLSPRPKWWNRRDGFKMRKLIIKEGITALGEYAFCSNVQLSSVSLPSTLTEIRGGALGGENRIKKIVIPEGVTVISWDAFYSCVCLEEIHIPASVYKIQTYAFHACVSLKKMYFYGDAPKTARNSFDMCKNDIVICHRESAQGWGETWNGFMTEVF